MRIGVMEVMIELVVDANVLVGELLRERGQDLLEHIDLHLMIAPRAANEAHYELQRRVDAMVRQGRIGEDRGALLIQAANGIIQRRLLVIPASIYESVEVQARLRIRRDPDDWPTVAVALAIGAGIWTNDQDFCGCGLPVWSTETLLAVLG
jgi:predicted nucleic acid-binding protein